MPDQDHLVFSLEEIQYGILTAAVKNLIRLPLLAAVDEAPVYIAGLLNLRGRIIPVIDLGRRLGRPAKAYRLSDRIIIVEHAGETIGLLVDAISGVYPVASESIETAPTYGREDAPGKRIIAHMARLEQNVVMLPNISNVISLPENFKAWPQTTEPRGDGTDKMAAADSPVEGRTEATATAADQHRTGADPSTEFAGFHGLADEDRGVFVARAELLARSLEKKQAAAVTELAVVDIGGEHFGFDIQEIQKFTTVDEITPVPCCPVYVRGNINLRGEVVTIIDIRSVLNLPEDSDEPLNKAVVIQSDDVVAGILINKAPGLLMLPEEQISAVPLAVREGNSDYFKGTAPYNGQMLGILNLNKTLSELIVDEKV